jgi:hypothetical protein
MIKIFILINLKKLYYSIIFSNIYLKDVIFDTDLIPYLIKTLNFVWLNNQVSKSSSSRLMLLISSTIRKQNNTPPCAPKTQAQKQGRKSKLRFTCSKPT